MRNALERHTPNTQLYPFAAFSLKFCNFFFIILYLYDSSRRDETVPIIREFEIGIPTFPPRRRA